MQELAPDFLAILQALEVGGVRYLYLEKLYKNQSHGAEPPCFERATPRLRGQKKLRIL